MGFPMIGITTSVRRAEAFQLTFAGSPVFYRDAVMAAGGIPVLIPNNLDRERLLFLLDRLDGVLLPGGADVDPYEYGEHEVHPRVYGIDGQRDAIEFALVRETMVRDMPLLGICRGVQVMNVALGGSLWQDVESMVPESVKHDYAAREHGWQVLPHEVEISAESKLSTLLQTTKIEVNSLHHQVVKELGEGLTATAWSPDGMIEGIEAPDKRFAVGVQWHPEAITEVVPAMRGLFEGFVEASAA